MAARLATDATWIKCVCVVVPVEDSIILKRTKHTVIIQINTLVKMTDCLFIVAFLGTPGENSMIHIVYHLKKIRLTIQTLPLK